MCAVTVGYYTQKGEVYERNLFTTKNKLFKQEDFVDEVKHFYTDHINLLVKDDKGCHYHLDCWKRERSEKVMAANVESVFYVRQTPWHGLGIRVQNAPSSKDALVMAGLDWEV